MAFRVAHLGRTIILCRRTITLILIILIFTGVNSEAIIEDAGAELFLRLLRGTLRRICLIRFLRRSLASSHGGVGRLLGVVRRIFGI